MATLPLLMPMWSGCCSGCWGKREFRDVDAFKHGHQRRRGLRAQRRYLRLIKLVHDQDRPVSCACKHGGTVLFLELFPASRPDLLRGYFLGVCPSQMQHVLIASSLYRPALGHKAVNNRFISHHQLEAIVVPAWARMDTDTKMEKLRKKGIKPGVELLKLPIHGIHVGRCSRRECDLPLVALCIQQLRESGFCRLGRLGVQGDEAIGLLR